MIIQKATTQQDFFHLVQLRCEVFVIEQHVDIQIEQDKRDFDAIHYLAYDKNQAVGCLRILIEEDCVTIGRVAVKKEFRNQGIGQALMKAIENDAAVIKKGLIQLHAQRTAENFYLRCGYQICSKPYMEAGIEHIMMEKSI